MKVAGEKVDPWFLFDKQVRDFCKFTMNNFDSLNQIASIGLYDYPIEFGSRKRIQNI